MKLILQFALLSAILFLSLATQCEPTTPLPPELLKPQVTLISPPNNATVALNDTVPVRALIKDSVGVLRVDFVVDGVIVDSQALVFASVQYDYQYAWKPIVLGARNISVVAYNSKSIASDPVSARVNVVVGSPTPPARSPTATNTPNVIVVTPAGSATATRTWTPRVVIVTPSPLPSGTPTITPTPSHTPFIIVITDTPRPSVTPTHTPFVVVVTDTPPATATSSETPTPSSTPK